MFAGRHRDPTEAGITNRKFLLLLLHRLVPQRAQTCTKAKHESPVIGPSSIVPFVAKTKFPTTSFSSLSTLNISPLKTVYTVWQSTDFVRWNVFNRRGCKHYRDITSPFFFRLDISHLLMFIDKNYSIFYACLTRNTTLISGGKSLD